MRDEAALAPTASPHGTVTDLRIGSPLEPSAEGSGLHPGELLGSRYRIGRFIARGGIGEVYEAHDALLDEPIAVKLLRPEISRKPGAQERFASEIRLAEAGDLDAQFRIGYRRAFAACTKGSASGRTTSRRSDGIGGRRAWASPAPATTSRCTTSLLADRSDPYSWYG